MRFTKLFPRYDEDSDMANASTNINNAKSSAQTAINSYDPTAAGNTSSGAVTSNFNTAQGQNAQAVDPLAATIRSNPTVTNLYQQGNDLYNVPQLAQQASRLQNIATNAVPEGYSAARGFDIDSTDINNGIAQKMAYVTPQLNAAENNYNTASGLSSNFVNAGIQQNLQSLIPAQTNAQLTAANQAAEATGWNQAQKSTLDGLLAKMQNGVNLSVTEMQTAQALAKTEEDYNSAIQSANIKNQYQPIGQNSNLLNTLTGSMVNPTIANPTGLMKLP